jgi:hypothetical protein
MLLSLRARVEMPHTWAPSPRPKGAAFGEMWRSVVPVQLERQLSCQVQVLLRYFVFRI